MSILIDQIEIIKLALLRPNQWHSFSPAPDIVEIVCACANLGIIKINTHNQMKLRSSIKARQFINTRTT